MSRRLRKLERELVKVGSTVRSDGSSSPRVVSARSNDPLLSITVAGSCGLCSACSPCGFSLLVMSAVPAQERKRRTRAKDMSVVSPSASSRIVPSNPEAIELLQNDHPENRLRGSLLQSDSPTHGNRPPDKACFESTEKTPNLRARALPLYFAVINQQNLNLRLPE